MDLRFPLKKRGGGVVGNAPKVCDMHSLSVPGEVCFHSYVQAPERIFKQMRLKSNIDGRIPNLAFQRTKEKTQIMYSFINIFCLQIQLFF